MAQLLNGFNPMDHDPSQGGGQLPLGKHPVIIESAEVKATADNANGMLILNLLIIDGPDKGQKGPYRLNLYHSSAEAVRIAHRQLSAVCHVTQTFQLGQDGCQLQFLFNKPFVIEVGYQKGHDPNTGNSEAKGYTEIKKVYDMQGNEPGKTGAAQQPQQPQQGFGGNQPSQPSQPQQSAGANAWSGNGTGNGSAQGQQPQGGNGGASWAGQPQPEPAANNAPQANTWAQNNNAQPQGNGGPSWGQRNG